MDKRERKPWGSCRVAFMANMKTIQERLEVGQPSSQIHRDLKGSLDDMPYGQFTHYIRKHITHATRKGSISTSSEPGIKNRPSKTDIESTPRFIPPDTTPDMSKYI